MISKAPNFNEIHAAAHTSVACIESTREINDRVETEKRYVISSLPADSRRILHAVRAHRGIENGLHWCLDVTFGEDASLIRLRNAAQNFALEPRQAHLVGLRFDDFVDRSRLQQRCAAGRERRRRSFGCRFLSD